jgi:CubicO group peptidase (beta-lactamase class C family)
MRTFDVPGIALAIVKDDTVVVAKGYGVRRMGDPAPVDGRTLFGIASNTKAFTATALGLLVEEGKIEWDGQVIRYLPGFAMWDPYVTRELTVRDLLVHRSGLGLARQLTTIVTPIPIGDGPVELPQLRANFNGYALGFGIRDYRGHKLVTHTGGLPGYVSRVLMAPDINLGVTVLTNQESGEAFDSIAFWILDHYLGAPTFDWIDGFKRVSDRGQTRTQAAETHAASSRHADSRPSLPIGQYAGTYRDAWYGSVNVTAENGTLTMRFTHTPALVGTLEHWQYDTFIARWRDRELRADAYVTFALRPDGSIDQIKMAAVSPATDFSFDFQDLLLKRSPANQPK